MTIKINLLYVNFGRIFIYIPCINRIVYKNVQDETKVELKEMKDKITGMERKQDQTKVSHKYLRHHLPLLSRLVVG